MSSDLLRKQLNAMEAEKRFNDKAYPKGLARFPRTLVGQGFFPGGDGLWRNADQSSLRQPSRHAFPYRGIMFLGNDFDTLASFQKLRLHENPPTWWRLRQRLESADTPGEIGFYTNAYLGLRSDRSALAHPIDHTTFNAFCAEYLALQIRAQTPRLVVVFGPRPARLLCPLIGLSDLQTEHMQLGHFEESSIWALLVSHPYSDLSKSPAQRVADGLLLGKAWRQAQNS